MVMIKEIFLVVILFLCQRTSLAIHPCEENGVSFTAEEHEGGGNWTFSLNTCWPCIINETELPVCHLQPSIDTLDSLQRLLARAANEKRNSMALVIDRCSVNANFTEFIGSNTDVRSSLLGAYKALATVDLYTKILINRHMMLPNYEGDLELALSSALCELRHVLRFEELDENVVMVRKTLHWPRSSGRHYFSCRVLQWGAQLVGQVKEHLSNVDIDYEEDQ